MVVVRSRYIEHTTQRAVLFTVAKDPLINNKLAVTGGRQPLSLH